MLLHVRFTIASLFVVFFKVRCLTVPMEGSIRTFDGLRLFYRQWEVPHPKAACLVIHGLAEHSGRYATLAQTLVSHSFAVWAMDHRGHGRSEGRRGDCRSLAEFVQDLHQLVQEVQANFQKVPRVLIGHSLGGLIALAYAVEHPLAVQAVAVSSPALRLAQAPSKAKVYIAKGLAHLLPTTPIPNGVNPQHLSHDPQVVEAYEKDPLVHRVLTARCAVALQRAMQEAPRLAVKLKVPCLILQAGSDLVCDPQESASFAKNVQNATVSFRRYEGLYHELFNEPQRGEIMEELCSWIKQNVR